jgi:hypothetical protein
MQVIYRCTTTLRLWSPLHRAEHRDVFMEVSTRLKDVVRDFFPNMDGSIICGSTFLRLSHGCFEMIMNDPFLLIMLGDPPIIVIETVNVVFFLSPPIYPQMETFCVCVSLFFNFNPNTMIFFLHFQEPPNQRLFSLGLL